MTIRRALYLLTLLLPGISLVGQDSPYEVTQKMLNAIDELVTVEAYMDGRFRMEGKIEMKQGFIRMSRDPFKMYFRQDHPEAGLELLYTDGENDNRALVKPNSFPWINLNLDPQGILLRKNSHHSIFETGFWYIGNVLEKTLLNYNDRIPEVLSMEGPVNIRGETCTRVVLNIPDFKLVPYRVREGEDLISIAGKLMVNEYMILEKNPKISTFWDVQPEEQLMVPNRYGKTIVYYINHSHYLPVRIEIIDESGLFESYEYRDIRPNVSLQRNAFVPTYQEYGFE